jgi:Subtilase family
MSGATFEWKVLPEAPLQTPAVKIDAQADRYFPPNAASQKKAFAVIGLHRGVSPRSLISPPDESGKGQITSELWNENISITLAYTSHPLIEKLATGGYCSGRVTRQFLLWLKSKPQLQALVKSVTLSRGPSLKASSNVENSRPMPAPQSKPIRAKVVLGVIDDWIGFANTRLRDVSGNTRFLEVWFQGYSGNGKLGFSYGRFNSAASINALLSTSLDEEQFEQRLAGPENFRPRTRLTHGTHVADLFGGYDQKPASEMQMAKDRPMLAVILPPDDVEDTSGYRLLQFHRVLDALNSMIATLYPATGAYPIVSHPGGEPPPLVINLSYGWYDCAHDGSSEFEMAMTGIMANFNQLYPNAPLTIVTSSGNNFQAQGHVVLPGTPSSNPWSISLRNLPDDRTATTICFELPVGQSQFTLTVQPPNSTASATVSSTQTVAQLMSGGAPLAGLLYQPPANTQSRGKFTLTIEPTADEVTGSASVGTAPHGIWQLTIGGAQAVAGAEIHGWIARDDSRPGQRKSGAQARFEDADYQMRDNFGELNVIDTSASKIKRFGALNSIATGGDAGPVSVAAAIGDRATDYSGSGYAAPGAATFVRGPDVFCTAEHSNVVSGILAAGTRSGSVVAMNGTSVAAPIAARAIADALVSAGAPTTSNFANKGRALAFRATGVSGSLPPNPLDNRKGNGFIPTSGLRTIALKTLRSK